MGLPLDICKMVHISFSNVHSILCSNLLLKIMNHTIRPESGNEVASCSVNIGKSGFVKFGVGFERPFLGYIFFQISVVLFGFTR